MFKRRGFLQAVLAGVASFFGLKASKAGEDAVYDSGKYRFVTIKPSPIIGHCRHCHKPIRNSWHTPSLGVMDAEDHRAHDNLCESCVNDAVNLGLCLLSADAARLVFAAIRAGKMKEVKSIAIHARHCGLSLLPDESHVLPDPSPAQREAAYLNALLGKPHLKDKLAMKLARLMAAVEPDCCAHIRSTA